MKRVYNLLRHSPKVLDRFFKLTENNTSVKIELLAGITTFLTMSYIIFVNPLVLHSAGMDLGAVFVATCIVTTIGCMLTGLLANYPIAIAPGMALNIYFSYTFVQKMGYSWQSTLGAVFISGIIFLLLTITKIRHWLIEAMPQSLNIGIAIGIGIFISLLALKNGGIIQADSNTLLTLANMRSLPAILFFVGFIIITVLEYYRVLGAIIIGILSITVLSIWFGGNHFYGVFSLPPSIKPTLYAFDLSDMLNTASFLPIFTFLLIAFFDGTGTLVGVLRLKNFTEDPQRTKKIARALFADSVATISGSLLGTSSTSPFIESAAGIREGGRTGLTAIVVAILFIFSLFLLPLARSIPGYAVAPALLYIGILMIKNVVDLNYEDFSEFIPGVITALMIPFTFSIAVGLGFGVLSYLILKIFTGKFKDLNFTLIILAIIFTIYFIYQGKTA